MARTTWTVLCLWLFLVVSSASGENSLKPIEQVAQKAVAARQELMQQNATASDVDAFLGFFTGDLIYEDPVVKMKIEGRDEVRKGMLGFLGSSRNARIVTTKLISVANVVVLDQVVSFEEKEEGHTWKPHRRCQITILEFEGTKIHRIADYWAR